MKLAIDEIKENLDIEHVNKVLSLQKNIRNEREKILSEIDSYKPILLRIEKLKDNLIHLQNKCEHIRGEIISSYSEPVEVRSWDIIECLDCGYRFEERQHKQQYPKRGDIKSCL